MADNCLQQDVNGGKTVPKRRTKQKSLEAQMSHLIRELHSMAHTMACSGCADRAKAGNQFLDKIDQFLDADKRR